MGYIINPYRFAAGGYGLADYAIAYYKLDETSGNREDSAGAFTLVDSGSTGYTTGIINNAANFAGATQLATSSGTGTAILKFAISLWMKKNGIGGSPEAIIEFCNATGDRRGVLAQATTGYPQIVYGVDKYRNASDKSLTGNVWNHVVLIYDGSTPVLYVNNATATLGAENATAGDLAAANIRLGNRCYSTPLYYTGALDEVAIFDGTSYTLDADDVAWLYNSGAGRQWSEY